MNRAKGKKPYLYSRCYHQAIDDATQDVFFCERLLLRFDRRDWKRRAASERRDAREHNCVCSYIHKYFRWAECCPWTSKTRTAGTCCQNNRRCEQTANNTRNKGSQISGNWATPGRSYQIADTWPLSPQTEQASAPQTLNDSRASIFKQQDRAMFISEEVA